MTGRDRVSLAVAAAAVTLAVVAVNVGVPRFLVGVSVAWAIAAALVLAAGLVAVLANGGLNTDEPSANNDEDSEREGAGQHG